MDATAEQEYATICAVVIGVAAVGTEVPGGQLCDDEQGRQVLSDDWPERRGREDRVQQHAQGGAY